MQIGSVKALGIQKPWAPPRSYGLVIRLGEDGKPLYSLHSRVDGINHGVVAALELGSDLVPDFMTSVRDGGFPPLLLDPVDFVGLYRQNMERQAAAQAASGAKPS